MIQPHHIEHLVVNRIGDVMVGMLASSAADRGFEPWSAQTIDYEISIKRRVNTDWLENRIMYPSEETRLSSDYIVLVS